MSQPPEPAPSGVTVLERRPLHQGRIFELVHERVRLPSGREQALDLVLHPGAVAIAARRPDGRLVVVRQYRHAAREFLVELPAGRLEAGEAPLDCARRELEEETGLVALRWSVLADFFAAPGFCSERLVLFLAEQLGDAGADRAAADDDEELEVLELTPAELLATARDAKTLLAAALLARR